MYGKVTKIGLLIPEDTEEFNKRIDKSNKALLRFVQAREHFPLRDLGRTVEHVTLYKDGEDESRYQFLTRAFGDTNIPINWIDEKLVKFASNNDFILLWYLREINWQGKIVTELTGIYSSYRYHRQRAMKISSDGLHNQLNNQFVRG